MPSAQVMQFSSPCKVNLYLNVLRRRDDGFHDLETVFLRVGVCDVLEIETGKDGLSFSCSDPTLPTDGGNLVVRASDMFFMRSGISPDVHIHLRKKLPSEAGLGGGSADAATTLQALNSLYGNPLDFEVLHHMASSLGSDVPFFLMGNQALGTGRGEILVNQPDFLSLKGAWLVVSKPEFGVPTGWAFQSLQQFGDQARRPEGGALALAQRLADPNYSPTQQDFFNSFEYPVFCKFPLLEILRDTYSDAGAFCALLSGSGSGVFGIFSGQAPAEAALEKVCSAAGPSLWTACVPLG